MSYGISCYSCFDREAVCHLCESCEDDRNNEVKALRANLAKAKSKLAALKAISKSAVQSKRVRK